MAQDAVVNIVDRLQECGFEPRRIGEHAWEARCPATGARARAGGSPRSA